MATLATVCGLGVVVARSPVVSVVSLLGTFAALAVVYLLAGYQFLAAIQVLVYGGAVMVLFLFTVMLLNLGDVAVTSGQYEPLFHRTRRSVAGLAIAVATGAAGLIAVLQVPWDRFSEAPIPEAGLDPLDELAALMFTRYSLPLEAASVLLLATAVGVLVLAKRNRPGTHRPFPSATAVAEPPPPTQDAPAPMPATEQEEVLS